MTARRLYRSRTDRQLAGVAGCIARYLDIDPTLVRVLWIFSIFFGGFGILLYIIMAFIVPLEPAAAPPPGWAPGGPAWGAPPASGPAWAAPPASGPAWGTASGAVPAAEPRTVAEPGAEPTGEASAEPGGDTIAEPGGDTIAEPGGTSAEPGGTSAEPGTPRAGAPAAWADPSAAAPAWATTPAWQAQGAGWQPPAERDSGRGALLLGITLVVFGGIALTNALVPGWIAGGWVIAAAFVALGVALLVGALRRRETTA